MTALRFRRASLAWVAVAFSTRLAAAQTSEPGSVPPAVAPVATPAAGAAPAAAPPAAVVTVAPSVPQAVVVPAPVAAPTALLPAQVPVAAMPAPRPDEVAALREEVRLLRGEVEAQRRGSHPAPPPVVPKGLGYEPVWPWMLPPEGLSVASYLQAQYETHQDSQDQLNSNGQPLNQDRFSIRRARVGLTGEWEYAALALQLDANTTNGPQVDLRKAEASLQYRPDRARPPMLMATLGLFDTPFGYELDESPHTRFFMERTTASRAWFPGEPDLGVRLAGALGFFRWTIAAQNGEPLGEASPYVEEDPNAAKDVIARFGFDSQPLTRWQLAGGVSALSGQGFNAGSQASGSSLQWRDLNSSTGVSLNELTGVPSQGATPSQNFSRWAVGADLRTNFKWALGVTKVYAEFVLAQNLDRGLYVANPIVTGQDQREFGFYVAALQDVTKWAVVGLRYDYYDPNSNLFDQRLGMLIPYSEAIKTLSPIVGLVLPDRARLLVQYDIVHNALARNAVGVPTNLPDNVLTLRFQVQL